MISLRNEVSLQQPVTIKDNEIECVQSFKLLGVILDHNLNFHEHTLYSVATLNITHGFC